MPKIFDRTKEEIGRVTRIDENLWFKVMQPELLHLVNTDYGKDLLCIPKAYKNIFKFGKNHVFYNPRFEDGVWKYDWDFRVGAKWANVIRSRWSEFQGALIWHEGNKLILPIVRNLVLTQEAFGGPYFPDPDVETTSVDGRSSYDPHTVWATAHDAADGTAATDTIASGVFVQAAFSAPDYSIYRSFYLFDTSAIPDGDTISDAKISLAGTGTAEVNDNATDIDVVASTPASNTAITTADYDQLGTTVFGSFAVGSWVETDGTYNDITLNATGRDAISKTGISKFGTRNSPDTDNVAPAGTNQVRAHYADQTGTAKDPKLTGTSTGAVKRIGLTLLRVG